VRQALGWSEELVERRHKPASEYGGRQLSWIEQNRMINKHKERLPKSSEALICAWR
jgi:hypothetical protein